MSAHDRDLETRLRRLEDAEEIRQLLLDYARCLDEADYVGYAQLFTEDGELHAQLGQAKGREAIRALLNRRLGADDAPPRRKAFHLIGNPTIQVEGDRATSIVTWAYLTHDDAGFPLLLQFGHYRDRLTRDQGRWRFERRDISRDLGFSPLDLPTTTSRRETEG
jgi:3-phenylpropionate/cinnamic acid dioxygenase small subunit